MVKDVIVLIHKVSQKVIDFMKAKIEVIENFHLPISVKGVRSFLDMPNSTGVSSRTSPKSHIPHTNAGGETWGERMKEIL